MQIVLDLELEGSRMEETESCRGRKMKMEKGEMDGFPIGLVQPNLLIIHKRSDLRIE